MPSLPHKFEAMRSKKRSSTLMVGSGVSYGLVCLPGPLLANKKDQAEDELQLGKIDVGLNEWDALYDWAGKALEALTNKGTPIPRLALASALGLLDDPEWVAKIGLPLRGTLPRHRVIARFAKERKWPTIWSFNWDTHIENALERIGVARKRTDFLQPWPVEFKSVVVRGDFFSASPPNVIKIYKPHGCVWALSEARECFALGEVEKAELLASRFLITQEDLNGPSPSGTTTKFHKTLEGCINFDQLVVAGWSISEPYLAAVFGKTDMEDIVEVGTSEEFSVLDIKFQDGHAKAAEGYQLSRDRVFFELGDGALGVDLDRFLLWLQSIYALDHAGKHAPSLSADLAQRRSVLNVPIKEHFQIDWADTFLPAWNRLCWTSEIVPCAGFDTHHLRIELEDEYIPLDTDGTPRPDIICAAKLLCALPTGGSSWNCTQFPGALFDSETGHLCIPLPGWTELNDLSGLAPFIRAFERQIGFVSEVSILPLVPGPDELLPTSERAVGLRDLVSMTLRVSRFATAENEIRVMQLSELAEG